MQDQIAFVGRRKGQMTVVFFDFESRDRRDNVQGLVHALMDEGVMPKGTHLIASYLKEHEGQLTICVPSVRDSKAMTRKLFARMASKLSMRVQSKVMPEDKYNGFIVASAHMRSILPLKPFSDN